MSEIVPINSNQPALIKIPEYRKELLFISYEKPKFHGFGIRISLSASEGGLKMKQEEPGEPSTIYAVLPAADPSPNESIPKLSYFPSYAQMDPKQRGVYLRWLYDVSRAIDVGYVFVYYYGLERHLVYGNFDAAFNEIILLRKFHHNGSFQTYSASALVHSCLLRKRVDRLQELYQDTEFDYFDNSNLLILYYNNLGITPEIMLKLANRIRGVNKRYINSNPDIYLEKISEVLSSKFGNPVFPLCERISLEEVEGIPYPIFANFTLSQDVRTPRLPNILRHVPFQYEIKNILTAVHNSVRKSLAESRKNA